MKARLATVAAGLALVVASPTGCDEEDTAVGPTPNPGGAGGQGASGASGGAGAGGSTAQGGAAGQGGSSQGGAAGQGGSAQGGAGGGAGGGANVCKLEEGICAGSATACTDGSGTLAPGGDSGCVFSDGAGFCCVPPAAAASGDTCESHGGVCAPIAGCNFVDGAFAPATDCSGAVFVCCVPESICGVEDVVCCAPGPSADFRPQCDRGTWDCSLFPGTTLTPIGDCAE